MGLLDGKRVVITGAGRGIGRAIAEAYAAEGASLVLTARTASELAETAKYALAKGAAEADTFCVDVANAAALEAFAHDVLSKGPVWGIVFNAGITGPVGPQAITEASREDMERVLAINLLAPQHLAKLFVPAMYSAKAGLLLFVGSISGLRPSKNGSLPLYSASKHGLKGYAANLHEILSTHGIKVCYLAPSFVATPMAAPFFEDMSKLIQASDVAEAALLPVRLSSTAIPSEIPIKMPGT